MLAESLEAVGLHAPLTPRLRTDQQPHFFSVSMLTTFILITGWARRGYPWLASKKEESDKRERRGRDGVCVCVGDCRHHHRHHRSVYKKNFFPTTFCVGDGNGTLSHTLSLSLCFTFVLEITKTHVQQSISIFLEVPRSSPPFIHSFINPLYPQHKCHIFSNSYHAYFINNTNHVFYFMFL